MKQRAAGPAEDQLLQSRAAIESHDDQITVQGRCLFLHNFPCIGISPADKIHVGGKIVALDMVFEVFQGLVLIANTNDADL